jgi:hypothetical protein
MLFGLRILKESYVPILMLFVKEPMLKFRASFSRTDSSRYVFDAEKSAYDMNRACFAPVTATTSSFFANSSFLMG